MAATKSARDAIDADVAATMVVAAIDLLKILAEDDQAAIKDARKDLQSATEAVQATLPDRCFSRCDECGARILLVVGCPDGAELCQRCFDAGLH
ncbi:MAG: hypothetical protein WBD40_18075 [Tepidisphaeraceae bacterium]